MEIGDYIAIAVIVAVVAAAIIYVVKQVKNGAKCIGCPMGNKCSNCNRGCDLGHKKD